MKRRAIALAGAATLATPLATQAKEGSSDRAAATRSAATAAGGLLASVNYDRQMAGIAPLVEDRALSRGCQQHARYMALNGALTHVEQPGKPGYTPEGASAGARAVLARNSEGFFTNPWRDAPLHEFQAMHPWLRTTGVGVSGQYGCLVTLGERDAPNPDETTLLTVPGPGQYIAPSQVAREAPFVPGALVGLPQGTTTGPHLYVYAVGPQRFDAVDIQAATLTAGDDGSQVPLRWVDATTPRAGGFLAGGAIVIPATPLRPGVTYSLRVETATTSANGTRLRISRTSSFFTGPDEPSLVAPSESGEVVVASSQRAPSSLPISADQVGDAQLTVALKWTATGLRARLRCQSTTVRCEGPLSVLVLRRGGVKQELRFVAGAGPLRVRLAPGRTIVRRLELTRRQRHHGKRRGFSVRFGGVTPVKLRPVQ